MNSAIYEYEEEEKPFIIKTYKKKELACLYNPNITPRCAIRMLTKWIKKKQGVVHPARGNRLQYTHPYLYPFTGQNHNQYSGHSLRMPGVSA